jgi:hypothetical protein
MATEPVLAYTAVGDLPPQVIAIHRKVNKILGALRPYTVKNAVSINIFLLNLF